jgi:hypothetical protein
MKIVLVYRPELVDNLAEREAFEGIEVLGVANDDDGANELIDRIRDEMLGERRDFGWKFHIDTV